MNADKLVELNKRLIASHDMCSWLELYAYLTWNKIGFIRSKKNLKITEPSITQDLVFQLYIFSLTRTLPITIYESKLEKAHGSDLEIAIEIEGAYVLFPTQAKIIYPNHKYKSIDHIVKGEQQIDLLLNYASKIKGIPLYLFYNTCLDAKMFTRVSDRARYNIESFGCSVSPASVLKREFTKNTLGFTVWTIPNFEDLHYEIAYPLSILPCTFSKVSKENFLNLSSLYFDTSKDIKFYTHNEIEDNGLWTNLASLPQIGKIEEALFRKTALQREYENIEGFNPKFRIVFSESISEQQIIQLT